MGAEERADDLPEEARLVKSIFEELHGHQERVEATISLRRFLDCITNKKTATILFAICKLGVSSIHEMKRLLHLSSPTIIEHQFVKLLDLGFISAITKAHSRHDLYYTCWGKVHPTTNKNATLYVPTPAAHFILDFYGQGLVEDRALKKADAMERRGEVFEKVMSREKECVRRSEKLREEAAVNMVGACKKCSRILTKEDQVKKRVKTFQGEMYCKNCMMEMYDNGEVLEAVRKLRAARKG